jgi:benzoate-CoA ligase family protein
MSPGRHPGVSSWESDVFSFFAERLGITLDPARLPMDAVERRRALYDRLDRPLRVCGMVPNSGEPGGGPFWVRGADGQMALQIVEKAQIDDTAVQREILEQASHFNPVDLVCRLRDHRGRRYDLLDYIDPAAAFVSEKSTGGKALLALEHPGLWNGAMAHWNTIFGEVPAATFAPVKTVFDLLRPEHQGVGEPSPESPPVSRKQPVAELPGASVDLPESLNIAERFLDARIREGRGERVALHLDEGQMSYADVQALSNKYGLVLRELGVRQEERVMIALPDGGDFVGALFGTLKIGAVVVMVNPAFSAEEIAALYAYTRARCAVVHSDCLERFVEAAVDSPWLHEILVVGGDPGIHPAFEDLRQKVGEELETSATHRDDPAIWLFSGGTTGRPKAVVQTHRSFANTTELFARRVLGYSEDDITLSVPKLFFGYATGSNLFFPFAVGASAVLFAERPTPEVLFEKIARHRPSILINVPTLINRMLSHPRAGEQDLSSLRFATSAGEALPVALYRRWKELFGVELLDGLGTAEMWHVFLTNRPGDVKPGTLGRVVEGFEIDVRDAGGQSVGPGEIGKLWVRGESRAIGYWQNMEKTQEAFRGPWFVGGDMVSRDAEGYVTFCGRGDDALKIAGRWLLPIEVENCLMEHASVKECAVVGAVEAGTGLVKPYAFVSPAEAGGAGTLIDELKAHTLAHLPPYKNPRQIIVLDDFPRTHLGKVDRGKLKGMV